MRGVAESMAEAANREYAFVVIVNQYSNLKTLFTGLDPLDTLMSH